MEFTYTLSNDEDCMVYEILFSSYHKLEREFLNLNPTSKQYNLVKSRLDRLSKILNKFER